MAKPKKQPGTPGRPSKLTAEVLKAICDNLELAMPLKLAAEAEGIGETTIHGWIHDYPDVSEAVTRARARAARNLTVRSLKGGPGSHAASFFLERRFRDHYGNVQRIEHAGHDGGAVKVETDVKALSDAELEKIANG